MKAYDGMEVELHDFLTSSFDGAEWSAEHDPAALSPGREPRYPVNTDPWTPESVWSPLKKGKKKSCPFEKSNQDSSVAQSLA
jgi:hypothetical protein